MDLTEAIIAISKGGAGQAMLVHISQQGEMIREAVIRRRLGLDGTGMRGIMRTRERPWTEVMNPRGDCDNYRQPHR